MAVSQAAVQAIDMRGHDALHPRLGAVDHISCHPLGPDATLDDAAELAVGIGRELSQPPTSLPVYFYGHAHPQKATLADIRRQLGRLTRWLSRNGW